MNWQAVESVAAVIGTALTFIAVYAAYKELKVSADNSKGQFILNLQEVYTNNPAYADLFEECWKNYLGQRSDHELLEYLQKHEKDVLNYLTFFESVYLMMERKTLDLKLLDELFGRRFFVVANNPVVQEFDLVKNKPYYANVFLLLEKWKKWRIDNKNPELFLHYNLENSKVGCVEKQKR